MQEKNDELNNFLPPEMVEKIAGDLNPKEVAQFALTSSTTLFKVQRNLAINKKAHDVSMDVAQGKQAEAKRFLKALPIVQAQEVLLTAVPFTDYSNRRFNCTAYEYAYWAKDTHMCRMLEKRMDKKTKTAMLKRCEAIEENGLRYEQHGVQIEGSKHFDFEPLTTALTHYVQGYNNWSNTSNWTAMKAAWMEVGRAQCNVPVYVINEYCRPGRSFYPTPEFDEPTLPRVVTYYDYKKGTVLSWFPLADDSVSSGHGPDVALYRSRGASPGSSRGRLGESGGLDVSCDLAAISRLDKVRTADLTLSREILRSAEPEQSLAMTY